MSVLNEIEPSTRCVGASITATFTVASSGFADSTSIDACTLAKYPLAARRRTNLSISASAWGAPRSSVLKFSTSDAG